MKRTSKMLAVIMVFALLATSMMISTVSVHATEKVVLEWNFNTVEDGVVKDSSGNGNDGTIGTGVTVADGVATFAGGNAGIALPDDVLAGGEIVTIEMTITPSKLGQYITLLGIGSEEDNWVVLALMADGAVRYAVVTDGLGENKGNSTNADPGANGTTIIEQSGDVVSINEEVTLKYVIEEEETAVYINGEEALVLETPEKSLISGIGGPIVLGKATKWPDPSFEGTVSSLKITIDDGVVEQEPTEEPADSTEEATATPEATEEATATPEATTAKPSATTAPTVAASATTTPATDAPTDGGFPIWIIIVIAAVVVAVVVVIIVAKKKKA